MPLSYWALSTNDLVQINRYVQQIIQTEAALTTTHTVLIILSNQGVVDELMTHLAGATDVRCDTNRFVCITQCSKLIWQGWNQKRSHSVYGFYSQSCIMCLICVVQSFQCDFLTMSTAEVKLLQVKFIPPTNPVISYKAIHLFFQRINGFPQSVLSSSYKGFWKQITINTIPSFSLGFNSIQIVDV